ncbi:MAG: hypothetical protein QW128_07880 [Thermoprotei archaeon]
MKNLMYKISALIMLIIILAPITFAATTTTTQPTVTQQKYYFEKYGWKIFTNGIITILIVGNGTKPMFIWWYNKDNSTAYVFKYNGLAEVWLPVSKFKHTLIFNDNEDYQKQLDNLLRNSTKEGKSLKDQFKDIIDKLKEVLNLKLVEDGKVNLDEVDKAISIIKELKNDINNLTFDETKTQIIEKLNSIEQQLQDLKNNPQVQNAMKIKTGIVQVFNDLLKMFTEYLSRTIRAFEMIMRAIKHPFYLPFDSTGWSLIGPRNITDNKGNVIGVQFTFNLTKVHNERFKFAEGNILIRNTLYFVPVQVKINNTTMNMTRAEMKSDIIIKHWNWNFYDALKGGHENKTIEPFIISILSNLSPRLVLIAHFTAPNMTKDPYEAFRVLLKAGGEDELEIENGEVETHGVHGLKLGVNMEDDTEINEHEINRVEMPGLVIKSSEGLIGGFFRFVPNATVTYLNGTKETVPVKGYFILHGKHVTTFLVYPYFNNGTLEHDPSIGITAPDITQEQPVYQVSVSTGGQTTITPISTSSTSSTVSTSSAVTLMPQQNYFTMALVITIALLIVIFLVLRKRNNV